MTWWQPHNFERKTANLKARMALLRAVRSFFEARDFGEVETPVLQIMPTADTHIRAFGVENSGGLSLQTSPELDMKKLLVAGVPKLYQICKTFRRETPSPRHSPEFTMLEWYRAGADDRAIMEDCEDLLRHCANALNITHYRYQGRTSDPFAEWQILSTAEAFRHYAAIDLDSCLEDTPAFAQAARGAGVRTVETDRWDDIFHAVMAEKIEPHLGAPTPAILHNYPACMAALARRDPQDPRYAQRFELYVCGMELANAFAELTDAQEQRARFEADMALKQELYGESHPLDEDFLKALEYGMPQSAGIALGLDRLAMLATGAEDIKDVMWITSLT